MRELQKFLYEASMQMAFPEIPKSIDLSANRRSKLIHQYYAKGFLRIMQAHDPLSALIVNGARVTDNGKDRRFDGLWSSSLVDSAVRGKPDIEVVDISTRVNTINDIFDVTNLPMIFDGDTGGRLEQFRFTVQKLDRVGISAVVIEDKIGLKRNSLFGNDVSQTQDDIEAFCDKLRAGVDAKLHPDFLVIARCESLILDKGLPDAILRCQAYLDAGADGIMIHSRKKNPQEIFDFADEFKSFGMGKPLVVVPTSFNTTYEWELKAKGVGIVVYANHLLRAAYPSMREVAEEILRNGRSSEVADKCLSINEMIKLIDHQP